MWASVCDGGMISHTHHQRNTTNWSISTIYDEPQCYLPYEAEAFKETKIRCYELVSSFMTSSKGILWQHTRLIICSNFMVTSREHLDSRTSRIASIPCEDTSSVCMSGLSINVVNWRRISVGTGEEWHLLTSWSQASRSWKSGADGVNSSMSWLTKLHNRACLSRWRLDSKSSSEKPSSI